MLDIQKLLAILLLGLAPSSGLEPEDPQTGSMSLDLQEVEVETILKTFAAATHSRLEREAGVTGQVTFRFDHLSWQTALNAICESAGCEWQLEQGRDRVLRVVVSPHAGSDDRIDMSLKNASAREVFTLLAQIDGSEIEVDPTIEGSFSFDFRRIRVDTALDALCENVGCNWSRDDAGRRLSVRPGASLRSHETSAPTDRLATRIDLDLEEAGAYEVLASLARLLEVEPRFPDELAGQITLDLENQTVGVVLDEVCHQLFLDWSLAQRSDGWSLVVKYRPGDYSGAGEVGDGEERP